MITEQELKAMCTPEFIKWAENLAEGFFIRYRSEEVCWFPLLIHRAVEGWNKEKSSKSVIYIKCSIVEKYDSFNLTFEDNQIDYRFENYQPGFLTHAECAMLHCLLDIFNER